MTITPGKIAAQRRPLLWMGVVLLFTAVFGPPHHTPAAEQPMKKVSLILLWKPQAQFAGYYVALDKGIYTRHGLEATIIPGGPDRSPVAFLQSGKADYAVLWLSSAIQQRAAGMKLVNIAQLIQRSSMMLVARKSSGITTPEDMAGKKVGLWGGVLTVPPRAFLNKYNIKVREVPQSYTVNLFLRGGVEVTSVMWYNEYHTLLLSGLEPDELAVFSLHDYGIDFAEDGLYTLEKTLRRDPDRVAAFVRASLEGWEYAFAHPDEAVEIVIKYMREARVPANRVHQTWMLDRMRDLILEGDPAAPFGRLDKSDYKAVAAVLRESGLIQTIPDYPVFTGGTHAAQ